MKKEQFILNAIGKVHVRDNRYYLEINQEQRPGLRELERFGHVIVLWWAHECDTQELRKKVVTEIPYANNMEAGVFSCRSEYRPNPVGITVCAISSVDLVSGILEVPYIDAFDGTPILDLKAYFPVSDRVRDFTVPEWVREWPEWQEEAYKLEELFSRLCGET